MGCDGGAVGVLMRFLYGGHWVWVGVCCGGVSLCFGEVVSEF